MYHRSISIQDKVKLFAKAAQKYKKPLSEIDTLDLRDRLISEEANETYQALWGVREQPMSVEKRAHLLKELCDLAYVVVGTAVDLGMDFDTAFNRVHINNMLKLEPGAVNTDDFGKFIKPKNFPKVNLEDLV